MYEKYLNTLGNLSITGYNSEYKNKPFEIKKEKLLEKKNDHTLKVFTLNEELLDSKVTVWNEKAITDRAKRLSKIIIEKYPYPKEIDYSIEFDNYIEVYYDEEENNFIIDSDYKLVGFKLIDKKINANNYKEVYKKLLVELYNIKPSILIQMAEDNWKYEQATRIYISTDKEKVSQYSGEKLSNNINIYIETLFDRGAILGLIKTFIDKYSNEISINDFCLLFDSSQTN